MATRYINFALGEYYHVYNRGIEKRTIFLDDQDYANFLQRMYILNTVEPVSIRDLKKQKQNIFTLERTEPLVAIGAYCLMPNHFHILLTPLVEGGVATYMNKLGTSYSMYFNTRYERSGRLYEGTYKAKIADTDEYLKYLYAYIHLNPSKLAHKNQLHQSSETTLTFLQAYPYSSFFDYGGKQRKEFNILNTASFPEYFGTAAEHVGQLSDWLEFYPKL